MVKAKASLDGSVSYNSDGSPLIPEEVATNDETSNNQSPTDASSNVGTGPDQGSIGSYTPGLAEVGSLRGGLSAAPTGYPVPTQADTGSQTALLPQCLTPGGQQVYIIPDYTTGTGPVVPSIPTQPSYQQQSSTPDFTRLLGNDPNGTQPITQLPIQPIGPGVTTQEVGTILATVMPVISQVASTVISQINTQASSSAAQVQGMIYPIIQQLAESYEKEVKAIELLVADIDQKIIASIVNSDYKVTTTLNIAKEILDHVNSLTASGGDDGPTRLPGNVGGASVSLGVSSGGFLAPGGAPSQDRPADPPGVNGVAPDGGTDTIGGVPAVGPDGISSESAEDGRGLVSQALTGSGSTSDGNGSQSGQSSTGSIGYNSFQDGETNNVSASITNNRISQQNANSQFAGNLNGQPEAQANPGNGPLPFVQTWQPGTAANTEGQSTVAGSGPGSGPRSMPLPRPADKPNNSFDVSSCPPACPDITLKDRQVVDFNTPLAMLFGHYNDDWYTDAIRWAYPGFPRFKDYLTSAEYLASNKLNKESMPTGRLGSDYGQ